MNTKMSRVLRAKRAELAFELVELGRRIAEVGAEVDALDYSLRVVDPDWQPPSRVSKPCAQTRLPRGAVAQGCLQYLRSHGELWAPALAKLLSDRYRLVFDDRRAEQDFASSVAVALRRYERKGIVEVVEKNEQTNALRWRLRIAPDGRLALAQEAA